MGRRESRAQVAGPWRSSRRSLDQWLRLRAPALMRSLATAALGLPAGSRVRTAFVDLALKSGYRAYNRRDFEVLLTFFDPDVEIHLHHVSAMDGSYRGHEGWRTYWRLWFDVWDESLMEPEQVLESGNRVLVLGRVRSRAAHSALTAEEPIAQLTTIERGLVICQEEWFDHAAGLDAIGAVAP